MQDVETRFISSTLLYGDQARLCKACSDLMSTVGYFSILWYEMMFNQKKKQLMFSAF